MKTSAHNHKACIAHALTDAENLCGKDLTPLRRQVLETLWHSHEAKGAYDILNELNKRAAKKLAPLSVYRALDFLVAHSLAHRIESLNAYVGCPHPHEKHALQFLVCRSCQSVTELEDAKISKALSQSAQAHQFTPSRAVVEVLGLCHACADHPHDATADA